MGLQNVCASRFHLPRMRSPFSSGERNYGTYLAIGAAVTVGTLKLISHIARQKRSMHNFGISSRTGEPLVRPPQSSIRDHMRDMWLWQRWANVGKDKVVLHMFPRGRVCPNLSPFVVKLELYLRMAEIPYEVDIEEPMGPKGKSPWITLNGEEIADSQLIIERLGTLFKKNFSNHLSSQDKAVALAMRILAEDHLLWCLAIWRFVVDDSKSLMKNMEFPLIFKLLRFTFKGQMKKMTHVQGMGRHTHAEVEEFGRKDLQSLSNWLGDKPYFMGEKTTEVDCAIFGILCQIEWCSQGSPYFQMFKEDFKNLSSYCHRIKEKYWPDWNQCLNPPLA